ncbi:MAG: LytTR family DNA-binding domain-containing protein [Verrucomicrobiota bacterium]
MLKALLIDDDRIVLESMRALLADISEMDVCGSALNAQEALDLIDRQQPDVLFLDVHMPGMDGFELVEKLPYRIDIIFVTTSEAHAIRAFECNALDYLLKPVDPDRLQHSVKRLISRRSRASDSGESFTGEQGKFQDYIYLPMAGSQRFIRADDIHGLQSHGNNSRVFMTDGRVFEIRRSLNEWEQRLDAAHFYRINREIILHANKILEVLRQDAEVLCIDEKNDRYVVSRRRVAGLKRLLSG